MKKMTKIPLILLALVCSVAAFAGADTLTACGVPQIFANLFGSDGGALAAGLLLPIGVQQTDLVAAYKNGKMIADQVMPVKCSTARNLRSSITNAPRAIRLPHLIPMWAALPSRI